MISEKKKEGKEENLQKSRRKLLKNTGFLFSSSLLPTGIYSASKNNNRVYQVQQQNQVYLTESEAELIKRKAKQRKNSYQLFAYFYSKPDKIEEMFKTHLPRLEDLVMTAIPKTGPFDAIDVKSDYNVVRKKQSILAVLRMGALTLSTDPGEITEEDANKARQQNMELMKKAKEVENTASNYTENDNREQVSETLKEELKETKKQNNESVDIESIIKWTNISPGEYTKYQPGNLAVGPTRNAANTVKKMAKTNLKTIEGFRKQIENHIEATNSLENNLFVSSLVSSYNSNLENVPALAEMIFGDERINVYVEMEDGSTRIVFLKTENTKVVDYKTGKGKNPDVNAYTTKETIDELTKSENPGRLFETKVNQGKITYEGVGIINQIKYGAASLLSGLL